MMAYARKLLLGSWHIAFISFTIILGVHVVAFLWLDITAIRAWIWPPEGPIVEQLAKLDHIAPGAETSVISDMFADRSTVNLLAKRPATKFESALSAAKFECIKIFPTEEEAGYISCINKSAGCTSQGDVRVWMIVGNLIRRDHGTATVSEIRSFVKKGGRC